MFKPDKAVVAVRSLDFAPSAATKDKVWFCPIGATLWKRDRST